jgi:hypothetical protein
MKFLECESLSPLNLQLSESGIDLGSCLVKGTLTAWSCACPAGRPLSLSSSDLKFALASHTP